MAAAACRLVEKAAWRLRAKALRAGGVTLKMRYADFRTLTRDLTIADPTQDPRAIRLAASS